MSKSESTLDQRTIAAGKYRHYKGGEYQVLDTLYHSETEELMVLYRPLYGAGRLWARPFDMFVGEVTIDGKAQARFQRVD